MLELHVADTDVTSGSIAVTWCVDKTLLADLELRKVKNPQLCIIVAPEEANYNPWREKRYVVNLNDLMAYVDFKVPGKNKIYGIVSYRDKSTAKERYLARDSGQYITDVLKQDGSDYADWLTESDDASSTLSEPLSVEVPRECFAPEPAAWEKTWVNHFFRAKPDDQCDFRRRRLFAYSIQPLLILGNCFLRFLFLLLATLIGAKNWSLKYLFSPLTYSLNDSLGVLGGGSIFIREPADEREQMQRGVPTLSFVVRKLWTVPFMPLLAIPLMAAGYHGFLHWVGLGFVIVVALLATVAFFASGMFREVFDTVIDWAAKTLGDQEIPNEEFLVCSDKKAYKLSDLPAHKRTLKLKFMDLKSKVCRPFSG